MRYIVIWLFFAGAAAYIAKGKDRNPVLWALIGALLGPFAIIIVALLESPSETNQKDP